MANYPFDGYPDGSLEVKGLLARSPDDVTFKYLATRYASLHTTMTRSNKVWSGSGRGVWRVA